MNLRTRIITLAAASFVAASLLAQAPPAPQTAPAPAGRGQGGAGRGGGGGGRRGGFTQFTRPVASQDVLARGQALYETNCASCHAPDLRGAKGTNLLRSGTALNDQHGELVAKAVAGH
ncbi:MAG: c-type cytochrome, partial [Candidatus Solibacter sp.]